MPANADSSAGEAVEPDPCYYVPVPVQKGDPRLGGDDPSQGVLYVVFCPDAISMRTGKAVFSNAGTIWSRTGVAPVAPPPDPAQIAQQAAGQLTAPNPVIHLGPDATKLAVKVPIWLSVDNPAPLTLTVAVRGLSVTVTATMTSTTWSMGEPIDPANPTSTTPLVTCQGAGTPAPPQPDRTTQPPCGYTYTWKSLPARTNGTGTWPITATTHWAVTWTASNGAAAALPTPLTPSTTQQVVIGEWRSSLVANPAG